MRLIQTLLQNMYDPQQLVTTVYDGLVYMNYSVPQIFVSSQTDRLTKSYHELHRYLRRWTQKRLFEALNISYKRVYYLVHVDLDMKKMSAKWIAKCLNVDQKHARVGASRLICARFEKDTNLLNRVVTRDKTSVHFHDPETKQHSIEWRHSGTSRSKNFPVQKFAGKVLVSGFWECTI